MSKKEQSSVEKDQFWVSDVDDVDSVDLPLNAVLGTDEHTLADTPAWLRFVDFVASERAKSSADNVLQISARADQVTRAETIAAQSVVTLAGQVSAGGTNTAAKYKIDRRMVENIWGRPKSPVNRREYGPGKHGQRRKGKLSDFGLQLRAKQKLKGYYGDLTEKQFKRIFSEAARVKGDTGENLIGLLERRLDAVVYRAKFVPTVFAARSFVNHGHVTVNGKRVNIPSYRVKEGDVIAVCDKSKQLAIVLEAVRLTEREVPDYIEADHSKMTATFVRTPGLGDVPYPVIMEPNLVVEYYRTQ